MEDNNTMSEGTGQNSYATGQEGSLTRSPFVVAAQSPTPNCPLCASQGSAEVSPPSYVYALGQIESRTPTMSVARELAAAKGRVDAAGSTDHQAFHSVINDRHNRYLARHHCWIFKVQGIETYILAPRDPADYDLLIQAVRPSPGPADLDLVIGLRGPMSPPQVCNGLSLPIVAFDQLYSFDRTSLIQALPNPPDVESDKFNAAAAEMFELIMSQTDNAGATDADRALNYLIMRYPAVYATTAKAYAGNASLTAVNVNPSPLKGLRNIVDVIFSYTNRATDVVQKYFVRVDVSEEFPFLISKLSPYYER
jgi:hypothetical protein